MVQINICKDFSEYPSGRTRKEGDYSGEEFRESILLPKFEDAEHLNEKLYIDFDGGYGYGPSFLEESFGGLVRAGKKGVWNRLEIKSNDDETVPERIQRYIKAAEEELKK